MNKKTLFTLIALVVVFVALRVPGHTLPYHQDEWKAVTASSSIEQAGTLFAHPPLQQIFFVTSYRILGEDAMRLVFILFGAGALVFLYLVVLRRTNATAALLSSLLFIFCYYNVLGSLMTDVDGSLLPFFLLLSVYAYDRCKETVEATKWRWFSILMLALYAGFLLKLSFILVVGTLALDFAWEYRRKISVRTSFIYVASLFGFGVGYVFLLYVIQGVYPAFNIDFMLHHANQFTEEAGRNYIQIVVQGVKALYYISPLALLLIWIDRDVVRKTRVFWLYLIAGSIFYFILFDFSRGALDKYLMFIIVPICVIVGIIIDKVFEGKNIKTVLRNNRLLVVGVVIVSAIMLYCNFTPQSVVALYPKTEWFSRVAHGQWNVLTPLNGGSGPMGFYVSFLFIGISYIVSMICVVLGLIKKKWRVVCVIILLAIALVYNGVFIEEYIHGGLNGSAPVVLRDSLIFLEQHPEIKQIITYNDTGAQALVHKGIYAGRFYATPAFEGVHRQKFAAYTGEYMVIGVPPLYKGFYSDFFSKCDTLFETSSGVIKGNIYACKPPNQ